MTNLIRKIAYKLARRKFVSGFDRHCTNPIGRVLVYNKTEEFFLRGMFQDFSHTNNWESYEIAKVLNRLGYIVDVIDRTATLEDVDKIKDEYDLFLGLGTGDSGQYFADIAERVPSAVRVLYAMGPEPDLSNAITKARHNYFRSRHPDIPVVDRRLIHNVDTRRLYRSVDAIITIGNEFSVGSYHHLGKDVYKIYLSSYPELSLDENDIVKKDQKKFLYFGGNGNITKGLDLVLEAFVQRPDLELYIGAPTTEQDFNVFADPIIQQSSHIHRLGFIDVTSKAYHDLTALCGYVIMPSSSEGCATSVTTCMRRGLIPVVTLESGIEQVSQYGFLIQEGTVESVSRTIDTVSSITPQDFVQRIHTTYEQSHKYTQQNFTTSLTAALTAIFTNNNYEK